MARIIPASVGDVSQFLRLFMAVNRLVTAKFASAVDPATATLACQFDSFGATLENNRFKLSVQGIALAAGSWWHWRGTALGVLFDSPSRT